MHTFGSIDPVSGPAPHRSVPLPPSLGLFRGQANEGSTAVPLILEHPFIGNAEALLQGKGTQRLRLARNCVLLLLSVRGDPRVNRCRLHGRLLRSPWTPVSLGERNPQPAIHTLAAT